MAGELERWHRESRFAGDDDFVFAHPLLGGQLDRSRLLKRFNAAARPAALRDVRFHDLRHTFGTRMAAAGVPMRTLQEWMGHRDFERGLDLRRVEAFWRRRHADDARASGAAADCASFVLRRTFAQRSRAGSGKVLEQFRR